MTTPKTKHSNFWYIAGIITLVALSFAFIIAISIIRPDQDNMQISIVVLGMLSTITVAFLGFIKSNEAVSVTHETKEIAIESKVVQEQTHDLMNSRMTEMMEIVRKLALAEGTKTGVEEGRKAEVRRVLDLRDKLQEGRDQVIEETGQEGT